MKVYSIFGKLKNSKFEKFETVLIPANNIIEADDKAQSLGLDPFTTVKTKIKYNDITWRWREVNGVNYYYYCQAKKYGVLDFN